MHGYGIKKQPEGPLEIQQWSNGALIFNRPLIAQPRCVLTIDGQPWMFESTECINGLAHGRGLAVRLDGEQIVARAEQEVAQAVAQARHRAEITSRAQAAAAISSGFPKRAIGTVLAYSSMIS